jgi:signal transduction histidine kinase
VRRFSRDLRPSVLDDLGLLPALEGLMADVKGDSIEAELRIYGDRRRLTHEAELVLFRIVQEALSNVRRHSRASRVVTEVEFGESTVRISVEDNGQGFEPPGRTDDLAAMGKLGLVGMRERAQLIGGTVAVESELGKGTTVIVEVPT